MSKEEILKKNCYFYSQYNYLVKRWFHQVLERFLVEIKFLGHGIDITNEIKITIGAWAVRVILKLPFGAYYYSHISVINIYPGDELPSGNIGEMVDGVFYCHVNLAWSDVQESIREKKSKSSTIIHEFVHALDQKDRITNGVPSLIIPFDQIEEWQSIFNAKYFIEHSKIKKIWNYFGLFRWSVYKAGDPSCVDVSEVLSVASEKYFEDPKKLNRIVPEVYEQLNKTFLQDTLKKHRSVFMIFWQRFVRNVIEWCGKVFK